MAQIVDHARPRCSGLYINWLLVVGGRCRTVKPPYQTSFFLSVSVGAFQRLFLEAIYDLPLRGPHGSKAGVVMIHSGLFCLGVASSTSHPTPSSESGLYTLGFTKLGNSVNADSISSPGTHSYP